MFGVLFILNDQKMKRINQILAIVILTAAISSSSMAQTNQFNSKKETVGIVDVYTDGVLSDPSSMGNLLRIELEKTGFYHVADRYDIEDLTKKANLETDGCYGKTCLVEIGKVIGADKMLTGSVERFGERIIVSLRLIDVRSATIVKSDVTEHLNIQPEIQKMIEISVKNLLGIENDPLLVNYLINQETSIAANVINKQNNSGPRMGVAYITGFAGERFAAPLDQGGWDMSPFISQFGYQWETQYLGSGNFQALFEFVGMVSGLEQGQFIPSMIIMNGFRSSNTGWEIAFGPSFSFRRKAIGYYTLDENGDPFWNKGDWNVRDQSGTPVPKPDEVEIIENLDKRGNIKLSTGWVWAVGKTFKSGHLNIPVNVYVSPNKNGWFVGTSVGFNIRKK
jgi:curli biogenesis system outer membrane secretion channel CsgG